jgi:hypothetical protein
MFSFTVQVLIDLNEKKLDKILTNLKKTNTQITVN